VTEHGTPDAPETEAAPVATAGMILARERASSGLTIDDVAMQLKLAPRQVVAIERDDFAGLPGRTFVRGFVRNYARLLKLDVDAVLAALPGDGAMPAPERPLLATSTRAMGELPRAYASKPGIARWAIPLVLVAIVAVAAFYEFARPPAPPAGPTRTGSVAPAASTPSPPLAMPAPGPAAEPATSTPMDASRVAAPAETGGATTANPPAPATTTASVAPSTTELPNPLGGPSPQAGVVSASVGAPASAAPPAAGAARNQLAITFRGTSWIEVRDRSGVVVLSMTGASGTTRELAVTSPGELIIGNAAVVAASWRGRPLDVAANSRQNVARLRLD
jgi:cytoskeleton protein RodZ